MADVELIAQPFMAFLKAMSDKYAIVISLECHITMLIFNCQDKILLRQSLLRRNGTIAQNLD